MRSGFTLTLSYSRHDGKRYSVTRKMRAKAPPVYKLKSVVDEIMSIEEWKKTIDELDEEISKSLLDQLVSHLYNDELSKLIG